MNSLSTFVEQSEATQSFSALEPHQSRDKKTIHTADSEINVPTETFQTRKLWLRQSQALFSKNATLLKRRLHWVLIRAFVIPVIFTLYMVSQYAPERALLLFLAFTNVSLRAFRNISTSPLKITVSRSQINLLLLYKMLWAICSLLTTPPMTQESPSTI